MMYAGIDWADQFFQICLIDDQGTIREEFSIRKTLEGFGQLLDRARPYGDVECAIETTRSVLVDFLLAQGFRIYWVNPSQIVSCRSRYKTSSVKDDKLDAYVIAQALRVDKAVLPVIEPRPEKIERLSILLHDSEHLIHDQARLKNRLLATLKEYYPAFLDAFLDPTSPSALAFLEKYPAQELAAALSEKEVTEFFKAQSVHRAEYAGRVHDALHRRSLSIRPILIETKSRLAVVLARQLLEIRQAIKSYDEALDGAGQEVEELRPLEGIEGIGLRGRIGALVYFHHRPWADYEAAQVACGMRPGTRASGAFRAVHFRFACIKWARQIFTQMAFSTLHHQRWARLYYDLKRKEGKRHFHALRCLGNVWIKILFQVWKNQTTYDHEKHYIAMTVPLLERAGMLPKAA